MWATVCYCYSFDRPIFDITNFLLLGCVARTNQTVQKPGQTETDRCTVPDREREWLTLILVKASTRLKSPELRSLRLITTLFIIRSKSCLDWRHIWKWNNSARYLQQIICINSTRVSQQIYRRNEFTIRFIKFLQPNGVDPVVKDNIKTAMCLTGLLEFMKRWIRSGILVRTITQMTEIHFNEQHSSGF